MSVFKAGIFVVVVFILKVVFPVSMKLWCLLPTFECLRAGLCVPVHAPASTSVVHWLLSLPTSREAPGLVAHTSPASSLSFVRGKNWGGGERTGG